MDAAIIEVIYFTFLAFCDHVLLLFKKGLVKRANTDPWQTMSAIPNKKAVNKAELQLTRDLEVLMTIWAGIPPSQIIFNTLACFPGAYSSELRAIICAGCLESGVICQEDLADLSLPQKKNAASVTFCDYV